MYSIEFKLCAVCVFDSVPASTNQPTEQGGVYRYRTWASICWLHFCTRHSTSCCHQLHRLMWHCLRVMIDV